MVEDQFPQSIKQTTTEIFNVVCELNRELDRFSLKELERVAAIKMREILRNAYFEQRHLPWERYAWKVTKEEGYLNLHVYKAFEYNGYLVEVCDCEFLRDLLLPEKQLELIR